MTLRESEAGYRDLFEVNPQPLLVCHRDSKRFLEANQAALNLYGYPRDEFLELSLPQIGEAGQQCCTGSLPERISNCRQQRKDGSSLKVQLACRPCRFRGEPALLVLVREGESEVVLQTQVADQEARLQVAQRELEAFSYSVSHDLQAPLRHIDGFSRALQEDYSSVLDSQAQEYLSRICQAAEKMSHLIDSMLQLGRVGRAELNRQGIDLSVKAQVAALELKHREPERQVELEIQEGVKGDADPRMARQLLEILIGNAWKFTSKNERAWIRFGVTDKDGSKAYFVSDNGVGFDMAYADKLFTVFHRLHRADEFEGSGVGLAIAQRIVARHGGKIWVESAPGAGATFYFTL